MGDEDHFTLDQLAEATGMTPRNVRAYQTRRLIARPTRVGRRSVYGTEHVRQLLAIQRARAEGASLELLSGLAADGGPIEPDAGDWLSGTRTGRSRSRLRRADLQPLLARLGAARTTPVLQFVEQLTALGLIYQADGRTFVGRGTATSMTALRRQGFPPTAVIAVAQHAASAAAPLVEDLLQLLDGATGGRHSPAAAGHTVDLAAGIVRDVLAARLIPRPRD
jgi:DNA-binding transcriptional MerR regulator